MFLIPLQLFSFFKRQGENLLVSWLIQVIQGGMINRGLLVPGLLPPPLGGFEGQDEINPLCDIPSDGVNGGLDVGWPSVTMEQSWALEAMKRCDEALNFNFFASVKRFIASLL